MAALAALTIFLVILIASGALLVVLPDMLVPITCTAASQQYLYLTQSDLGWVGPSWREMGVPLYLDFAFWRWLTGIGILVYLFVRTLPLRAEVPASVDSSEGLDTSLSS